MNLNKEKNKEIETNRGRKGGVQNDNDKYL